MRPEILEFAQKLISEVRDRSVRSCGILLNEEAKGLVSERWRRELQENGPNAFVSMAIPDCIDDVLFHLLHAIDSGIIQLSYTAENGHTVNLTKAGESEMAGWYMGTNGWREEYSHERFYDDFADLK